MLGATGISMASTSGSVELGTPAIKMAGYDYDRVRDIIDGGLGFEKAGASFDVLNIYDASRHAFGPQKTYEVTEIGLMPFLTRYVNEGFRDYTLVPAFVSRTFRHRNVFVHVDSGIEEPADLRGRRVGTPGYGFSANTWIRGFLKDEYDIDPSEMRWIQTRESSDGAAVSQELQRFYLPDDFPLSLGPPGVDESELLLSGGCDALITAITPKAFLEGNPNIRRLFPDVRRSEQDYFRRTGVFPIMHAVAIRADAIEAMPWLPTSVFNLYSQAKQIAYSRLESTTALLVSLPWVTQEFEATQALMGENYWPYGIDRNQKVLELAVRYAYEQKLIKSAVDFRELFHPSTLQLQDA